MQVTSKGLKATALPIKKDFVFFVDAFLDNKMESKEMDITFKMIKANNRLPAAFITISDIIAYGLLKALRAGNIKVPEEVSAIGFDDIVFND